MDAAKQRSIDILVPTYEELLASRHPAHEAAGGASSYAVRPGDVLLRRADYQLLIGSAVEMDRRRRNGNSKTRRRLYFAATVVLRCSPRGLASFLRIPVGAFTGPHDPRHAGGFKSRRAGFDWVAPLRVGLVIRLEDELVTVEKARMHGRIRIDRETRDHLLSAVFQVARTRDIEWLNSKGNDREPPLPIVWPGF